MVFLVVAAIVAGIVGAIVWVGYVLFVLLAGAQNVMRRYRD